MSKILFASDHGGFALKQDIILFVKDLGFETEDFGNTVLDGADDYPDFVIPLAQNIAENPAYKGIILGGSGQGEAICANRFKGVRAVVYYGKPHSTQVDADGHVFDMVTSSRIHNNANVLSLGARFLSVDEAKAVVKEWLEAEFPGDERHKRRLEKIEQITK
jgi:ribose 5-phosphate isomerase B